MSEHISQRMVARLKPPTRGNRIVYDDQIRGFGVRVTRAGAISFVLGYSIGGRERRYTIGQFPVLSADAARARAIQLRAGILEGQDPLQERESARTESTVADLAREYLERHAAAHKRASSVRNDRQMLDGIVTPRLGKLRVSAVGVRDVAALHQSLKGTPYRANRVRALLSKMFALAMQWGWRSDNPVKGVPKFHEDKREAWLSVGQLNALETALASYSDASAADALRLLILTGARESEVLRATWDQFDLERGTWTKPSHHTKEKRTEHIPLNPPALQILRRMEKAKTGPYLFPGAAPRKPGAPRKARVTIRRPWVQVCKAAGLVTEVRIAGKRIDPATGKPRELARYKPVVRIHDLRHSFASHLVSKGESLHIVGALLGHTQPQTTARYAHLADTALRDATNRFAGIIGKTDFSPPKKRSPVVTHKRD